MMLDCGCPSEFPNWSNQDVDLGGQCTLRLSIPTLFHMPLAYEAYMRRQQQEVERGELKEKWPGFVITQTGLLGGAIYRPLEKGDSPSHHIHYLPRPFHVHGLLHHGDIGTIRKATQQLQSDIVDAGHMPKEMYLCYLTCPKCAEERGGSKILLLRRWEASARLAQAQEKQQRKSTKTPTAN